MTDKKKPTRQTEPAIDPVAEGKLTAKNTETAVEILLNTLGIDPRALTGLEVRPAGSIRVVLHDRSARSVKFTPLPRYERDRDGRIIE